MIMKRKLLSSTLTISSSDFSSHGECRNETACKVDSKTQPHAVETEINRSSEYEDEESSDSVLNSNEQQSLSMAACRNNNLENVHYGQTMVLHSLNVPQVILCQQQPVQNLYRLVHVSSQCVLQKFGIIFHPTFNNYATVHPLCSIESALSYIVYIDASNAYIGLTRYCQDANYASLASFYAQFSSSAQCTYLRMNTENLSSQNSYSPIRGALDHARGMGYNVYQQHCDRNFYRCDSTEISAGRIENGDYLNTSTYVVQQHQIYPVKDREVFAQSYETIRNGEMYRSVLGLFGPDHREKISDDGYGEVYFKHSGYHPDVQSLQRKCTDFQPYNVSNRARYYRKPLSAKQAYPRSTFVNYDIRQGFNGSIPNLMTSSYDNLPRKNSFGNNQRSQTNPKFANFSVNDSSDGRVYRGSNRSRNRFGPRDDGHLKFRPQYKASHFRRKSSCENIVQSSWDETALLDKSRQLSENRTESVNSCITMHSEGQTNFFHDSWNDPSKISADSQKENVCNPDGENEINSVNDNRRANLCKFNHRSVRNCRSAEKYREMGRVTTVLANSCPNMISSCGESLPSSDLAKMTNGAQQSFAGGLEMNGVVYGIRLPPFSPVCCNANVEVPKMDVLSEEIWHFHSTVAQTDYVLGRKLHLRDMIYYAISPVFPMCGLYIVGSSLNGFGNSNSDMDLCLMITNKDIDQRNEAMVVLTLIRNLLTTAPWIREKHLIAAKVPILRINFLEPYDDITVDLNVNNAVAIRNTHLLCHYSVFDWRVRPLISVVKEWAKRRDINDANRSSFTSYSLVLMVIHFLQCGAKPRVLPSLQEMYPKRFSHHLDVRTLCVSSRLDTSAAEDWNFCNTPTLGELLIGFLDYYANRFDCVLDAISVRLGRKIDRAYVTRQYSPYNCYNSAQWNCICIEEPFTLSNTAHSVHNQMVFDAIREVFRHSHAELDTTRDLKVFLNGSPMIVPTRLQSSSTLGVKVPREEARSAVSFPTSSATSDSVQVTECVPILITSNCTESVDESIKRSDGEKETNTDFRIITGGDITSEMVDWNGELAEDTEIGLELLENRNPEKDEQVATIQNIKSQKESKSNDEAENIVKESCESESYGPNDVRSECETTRAEQEFEAQAYEEKRFQHNQRRRKTNKRNGPSVYTGYRKSNAANRNYCDEASI